MGSRSQLVAFLELVESTVFSMVFYLLPGNVSYLKILGYFWI